MTRWSQAEVDRLLLLRRRNMTIKQISPLMGRTTDSVRRAWYRYSTTGVPKSREPVIRPCAARTASDALKSATIRAIVRHANLHSVHVDVAARRLLSEGVA